ncbi:MAG: hypothetical protein RL662_502 [Bacteroidota bacterium]|jgi:peroxiredoxin
MKYLKYFFIAGVLLIASSYTTRSSEISKGLYPGNLMPELKLNDNAGKTLNLERLKGVKVLVNFWAAYDAKSHMENVLLWNTLLKENYPVVMVSVSFDKTKSVFEKTLNMDGIDPKHQYFEALGTDSEIYKRYELERGFKNYLIDENGQIMAMNLTPTDLGRLMK